VVDCQGVESTNLVPSGAQLWSSVSMVSTNVSSTESVSIDVLLHDVSDRIGHVLDGTEVL